MVTRFLMCLVTCFAQDGRPSVEQIVRDLGGRRFATRRDAVRACRGRTEAPLLRALEERVRKDAHPNIRAWAIEELGTRRDHSWLPLFRKVLAEDRMFPQQKALVAIGKLRDPALRDEIAGHLETPQLKVAAAQGLGELGDAKSYGRIAEILASELGDWRVNTALPGVLAKLDSDKAITTMLGLWRGESTGKHRNVLITPLQQVGGAKVHAAMLEELDQTDRRRKRAAIDVLSVYKSEKTTKRIMAVFEAEPGLRINCARAIAKSKARGAPTYLASYLDDKLEADVRAELALALGTLGDPRVAGRLVAALRREKATIAKIRIIEALGRIGERRAVATLIGFLSDDSYKAQPTTFSRIVPFPWNTRTGDAAAWAIERLRGKKTPKVDGLLSFQNPGGVKWAANRTEDIRRWWNALEDKSPWSRKD